jgi:K(+)-stimulated pyrophosphate-energized sodium pump
VALNPIIKFTTLFGLLAVEIAVKAKDIALYIGVVFFLIGLFFVWRSFYGMRISTQTVREGAHEFARGSPVRA